VQHQRRICLHHFNFSVSISNHHCICNAIQIYIYFMKIGVEYKCRGVRDKNHSYQVAKDDDLVQKQMPFHLRHRPVEFRKEEILTVKAVEIIAGHASTEWAYRTQPTLLSSRVGEVELPCCCGSGVMLKYPSPAITEPMHIHGRNKLLQCCDSFSQLLLPLMSNIMFNYSEEIVTCNAIVCVIEIEREAETFAWSAGVGVGFSVFGFLEVL
jgi:hypothetical protein